MDCKKAEILLAPHILGDLDNEPQRCKELQAHLIGCPDCAEMYDGFKETIGFVLNHKPEFAQAFEKARAREKKYKEVVIDCKQAQLLMSLFVANGPDLTGQQHTDFQEHIENCPECTKEYEESKFAIELARQHWPISDETVDLIEKAGQSYKPKMTVEEGWKDLCKRCPELAESTQKPKSLRLFLRISAVAACLVIGVLTWMVFSNYPKQQTLPHNTSSQQVAAAPKPSVKVELLSQSGNIAIPTGKKIVSGHELKTLLINGKHQMMMNAGTSLFIEPLLANAQLGCLVKLTAGEIYIHVEHDGNPFVVETNSGKATITGTTFNIKADSQHMELVVTEGTVRFENGNGEVNVEAGQLSEIVNRLPPTRPATCNANKLAAWATGYDDEPVLTQTHSNSDMLDLPWPTGKAPIVLVETDYISWIEEKRNWFKKDFPWIFELKDALAKESIEVDFPELLIKSGDVCQFVFLQRSPAKFSVPDFESLLRTAVSYGFDKNWLLKNVPTAKLIQNKSLLLQNPTGLAALEQLLKYVNWVEATPYYLYLADACKYLAETRSLLWFAVKNGQYNLTNEKPSEVLVLLQKEVTAACNCQNALLYPPKEAKEPLCDEDSTKILEMYIQRYIETVQVIEEKILTDHVGQ